MWKPDIPVPDPVGALPPTARDRREGEPAFAAGSFSFCVYPPVNGNHYVALAGRMDGAHLAELDAALESLLAQAHPTVVLVLDLTEVDYIGCAGIGSILRARQRLPSAQVLVMHPQAQVRRALNLSRTIPAREILAATAFAATRIDAIQRDMLHGQGDDEA